MPFPELTAAIDVLDAIDPESIERPDTAAWVLLSARATNQADAGPTSLAKRLSRFQEPDGSLPVHPNVPQAHWPTLLAAAAWNGLAGFEDRAEAALRFILQSTGKHWPKRGDTLGHDTAIVGWSWVAETHSWVIPTSLAMLVCRLIDPPAALEDVVVDRRASGSRMLLDRQITEGGWNYGNTVVFRNSLKPLPEETAWALAALAPVASRETVTKSLKYLRGESGSLVAPITLSAALLAWSAWDEPVDQRALVQTSLASQNRLGAYPIAMTAQLLACFLAPELLLGTVAKSRSDVGESE